MEPKIIEILFVDDEPHILKALKRTFHGFNGWKYHFANSPQEAIEIIAKNSIDVLVSDHKMPQMEGAEFLSRVKIKRPNMARIMLTGHADLPAVEEAVNKGEVFRFMLKPWDDEELKQVITDAVEFKNKILEEKNKSGITEKQNEHLVNQNTDLKSKVQHRTSQLSDALVTAQALNESLKESLRNSSKVFFSIIELARPQLGAHARKVAEHAVEIGKKHGLNNYDLVDLEIASLLHDIGKVGFPLFMMEKNPSDYNREEFEIYKTHPAVGSESLRSLEQYEKICKYIETHHERYDKSGFPHRLKSSEIPLQGYIIGISDELEYLLNRPHSDHNFINQYAFQKIADMSGKAFPADVTEMTMEYIDTLNKPMESEKELRIGLADLRPNMKLTRDTYTMSGLLLVTKGSILTLQGITRIRSIARVDPIAGEIYITYENRKQALSRV